RQTAPDTARLPGPYWADVRSYTRRAGRTSRHAGRKPPRRRDPASAGVGRSVALLVLLAVAARTGRVAARGRADHLAGRRALRRGLCPGRPRRDRRPGPGSGPGAVRRGLTALAARPAAVAAQRGRRL